MDNLKSSKLLKMISYILLPIFILLIGLSIFHFAFLEEYGNTDATKFVDTEMFANKYAYYIADNIENAKNQKNGNSRMFMQIEDLNGDKVYYLDKNYMYSYYNGINEYVDFIIIDKETNEIYTNIKIDDYNKEIENMKNAPKYWNYNDGKIETNIEYINNNNIKFNTAFQYFVIDKETNETHSETRNIENYTVYSKYNPEKTSGLTNYKIVEGIYEFCLQNKSLPIYILPISIIGTFLIAVYLLCAIGHEKNQEEVKLSYLDKLPYELIFFVGAILLTIFATGALECINIANYITLIFAVLLYFICYIICAIVGVTTIKRIKAKSFIKSFFIYKMGSWCLSRLKKVFITLDEKATENKRIFWYYLLFIIVSIMLACLFYTGIAIILLIGFWIWAYYRIKKYILDQEKIKNALKDIYEGKNDVKLDDENLRGVLKEMAVYVNDIASGFSNAIQESLKSERLKTELITNVSHDIKTPLTSIINYVDLLKKENIQDEKAREYIEILDQKSQRLKKLTEDLVEASKVSSGNVKLNLEDIDIKELFNQTIGEFKDKFEEKNLKIETQIPKKDIKIKADSRYLYRIIENLFSNITKYALPSSRVYIDVVEKDEKFVNISIKNISKDKLNISSDELMQRFVRGDKSRYTEGSGLGLSIAKSLSELQGGKFNITIDGDLFKVDLEWKMSY